MESQMEIWKEIYNYDVLYEVSNLGRVRTRYDKYKGYTEDYRYLKAIDNGNGYLRFNWRLNGRQRTVYLHQLVAQAFIENPNKYNEINHKDENKYNNKMENLEWCEHIYNCRYGTRNQRAKIKKQIPVKCVEANLNFSSIKEAAEWANVCITAISNCLNGRSKSCRGYTWRYAYEL